MMKLFFSIGIIDIRKSFLNFSRVLDFISKAQICHCNNIVLLKIFTMQNRVGELLGIKVFEPKTTQAF